MRLKEGLRLRKMGRKYMIVNASNSLHNRAEVFTLNEVAAQMWQFLDGKDFTAEVLVEWLCQEYDVEEDVARMDVEKQLEEWKRFGLIQ